MPRNDHAFDINKMVPKLIFPQGINYIQDHMSFEYYTKRFYRRFFFIEILFEMHPSHLEIYDLECIQFIFYNLAF